MDEESKDMDPLFDCIIKNVKAPQGYVDKPLQLLISTIEANEYVGKIGIGKIERGTIARNQQVALVRRNGTIENVKVSSLYVYNGLKKVETEEAQLGDIVAVAGILILI